MTLSPARLGAHPSGDASQPPYAPDYGDVYHPVGGAGQQARSVFLAGNGLPARWRSRPHFVILETGFGLGNNFLATWAQWREDAQRCDRLIFMSVDKHPLRRADLAAVHGLPAEPPMQAGQAQAHAEHELAGRLWDAWPPLTPGWHTIHLDRLSKESGSEQSVTLQLGWGDVGDLLPGLQASVDAFFLDGFSPARNPAMWDSALLSRLDRLAAPEATAATWSSAGAVREALKQAHFEVKKRPGEGGKWATTVARHAPRFLPPPTPGGLWPAPDRRDAVVIGAGIAGCCAADALTREGWQVTLLDAAEGPAQGASGNPGGLFHAILHGEDSVHARAHRAAALAAWRRVRPWIEGGRLPGQVSGLLRLDPKLDASSAQELVERLPWLAELARWLSPEEAAKLSGLPLSTGGWLFEHGGWFSPVDACRLLLQEAQARTRGGLPLLSTRWRTQVHGLARTEQGWQVKGADGQVLASAGSVVLATAWQTDHLLASLPPEQAVSMPPCSAVRGQVTLLNEPTSTVRPRLPVAGQGYVLALDGDRLLCGATTRHDDMAAELREADHAHNLAQARRLGALSAAGDPDGELGGRVGWRATTPDRLPLVGALPWHPDRFGERMPPRAEQVRMLPRERQAHGGLYMLGGLGSRGLTWSALAGELLAHWVCGTPCPVELDLRDALDPARFLARQNRYATQP